MHFSLIIISHSCYFSLIIISQICACKMLFNSPYFGPELFSLTGGRIAAVGRPQGAAGLAGQGQQQGRAGPRGQPGGHRAAGRGRAAGAAGRPRGRSGRAQPLSSSQDRLRRAALGQQGQQCRQGAAGLSGPLRRRRRSAGNKKPPPGRGQGQGPQGGTVGGGISPAR